MSKKEISARDRIVAATIGVIGQEGLQSLTTRRIAQEADVNIAAINYYFGSKDKLVELALEKTLDEMAGLPGDFLELEKLDARARLRAFLAGLMGGAVKYPGLVKAHLYPTLIHNDYDTPFVRRFNVFLAEIYDKAADLKAAGSEQDTKVALIQILSAILMPAVFPKIFQEFAQVDFGSLEARKSYIDSLLRYYLA